MATAATPREIAEEAKVALRVLAAAPRPKKSRTVTIYSNGEAPGVAVTVPREAYELFLEILGTTLGLAQSGIRYAQAAIRERSAPLVSKPISYREGGLVELYSSAGLA